MDRLVGPVGPGCPPGQRFAGRLRVPGIDASVGQPTEATSTVLKTGIAGLTGFDAAPDARWRFGAPSAWPKRAFGATVMSNLIVQVPNRGAGFYRARALRPPGRPASAQRRLRPRTSRLTRP